MGRMNFRTFVALSFTAPGILARLGFWDMSPGEAALASGLALSAALVILFAVLNSGRGMSRLAFVLLISAGAIVPDFLIESNYVWTGVRLPGSEQSLLMLATTTGSSRLMFGLGLPLIILVYSLKTRGQPLILDREHAVAITFLFLISIYVFTIFVRGYISHLDAPILLVLFAAYAWRLILSRRRRGNLARASAPSTPSSRLDRLTGLALVAYSAAAMVLAAGLLSDALLFIGLRSSLGGFELVQGLIPLATKTPFVLLLVATIRRGKETWAVSTLLSAQIALWSLVLGLLAFTMFFRAVTLGGAVISDFGDLQRIELLLAISQAVFAGAIISGLRLTWRTALVLFGMLSAEWFLSFVWPSDGKYVVQGAFSAAYLGGGAIFLLVNRVRLNVLTGTIAFRALDSGSHGERQETDEQRRIASDIVV